MGARKSLVFITGRRRTSQLAHSLLFLTKPNRDILEHDRKRQVELRLLVLRDALEEQGYTEAEIEERVAAERKAAEIEVDEDRPCAQGKGFTGTQGHHAAARKENQLQTMRAALGLDAEGDQKKGGL
ncbi:unnamed protein product [Urochloa humidicola]